MIILGAVLLALTVETVTGFQSRQELARQELRAARQYVDAVLYGAKILMQEVAGVSGPGERRLADGFGSWRDWS